MKTEKLQKVLARAGYDSRRALEQWIDAGRVVVNGRVAQLGQRVGDGDTIYVDGQLCKRLYAPMPTRVLLYHKPEGLLTTRHDPEGRETVFDMLPPIHEGKWISVGRLDCNTSGLLLFTNDGELAHSLTHPSMKIEREYAVRVMGAVDRDMIRRLTTGVELEDGMARFEALVDSERGDGLNHWFHVIVLQGRNRIVRRLWESQGLKVNRLKRVRFGSIILPKSLGMGAWLELTTDQIKRLTESVMCVISYNVGILGAQVHLTALSSVQGGVIRTGLIWEVESLSKRPHQPPIVHANEAAQPVFIVTPGDYGIRVRDHNEMHDLGTVHLEQNTSTDLVFILENKFVDDTSEFFSEHDLATDFARRQQERDAQSIYGLATLPLRDPNPDVNGDMGVQFMAHPLLQLPQFDGIPPDLRPDPSQNKEALQLTLTQKLAAAPGTAPTPSILG